MPVNDVQCAQHIFRARDQFFPSPAIRRRGQWHRDQTATRRTFVGNGVVAVTKNVAAEQRGLAFQKWTPAAARSIFVNGFITNEIRSDRKSTRLNSSH